MIVKYLGTSHIRNFCPPGSDKPINGDKIYYAVLDHGLSSWDGAVVRHSFHEVGDPLLDLVPGLVPFDDYDVSFRFGGKKFDSIRPIS